MTSYAGGIVSHTVYAVGQCCVVHFFFSQLLSIRTSHNPAHGQTLSPFEFCYSHDERNDSRIKPLGLDTHYSQYFYVLADITRI